MSIKLVIADIEGVITDASGAKAPLDLKSISDIRKITDTAPIGFCLCSGRQVPFGDAICVLLNFLKEMPAKNLQNFENKSGQKFIGFPSVLENGAYFWDPVSKKSLPHPLLNKGKISQLLNLKHDVILPLIDKTKAQLEPGKDFSISFNPPIIDTKSSDRENTDVYGPIVKKEIEKYLDLVEIKWSRSAIDITPKGISKASGIRTVIDWLGLESKEILGVGDSGGDEDWLKAVGVKAAPSNGKEFLKGMDYYADYESSAGFAQILKRLKDNNYEKI